MSALSDVVIIGAGPYGLSIAAHLRRRGIGYRIFGVPMLNWRTRMPEGMLLKSDGFASNLSDPDGSLTLGAWCRQQGIAYADEGVPVATENFIAYGEAFQKRLVPDVDQRRVAGLKRSGDIYQVELDDGEIITAAKIVIAVGISDFSYLPPELAALPREYVTHASDHAAMDVFKGREVAVIGGGASGIDIAALLHENGASVQVISRSGALRFHTLSAVGHQRSLQQRLRWPGTGIGPGWRCVFYTQMPLMFRLLPEAKRLHIVATSHAPAAGWPMRDRVVGKVPVLEGFAPRSGAVHDGRLRLDVASAAGEQRTVTVDHAIACTGYKVDLRKLKFLDDGLRTAIRSVENTPILSPHFETSLPGLYIVGPASANAFGPMFRFVYGAEFTAPRIAGHLAAMAARRSASVRPALAAR